MGLDQLSFNLGKMPNSNYVGYTGQNFNGCILAQDEDETSSTWNHGMASGKVEFSASSDELEGYLKKEEYGTIIKDTNLFWLTYCKASASSHQNEEKAKDFSVSIQSNAINFSGYKYVVEQTQEAVEKLRRFFIKRLESKKSFEILVLNRFDGFYFKKENSLMDVDLLENGYNKEWYYDFIKPALPQLAELCGCSYTEESKDQLNFCLTIPTKESVEVIRIDWRGDFPTPILEESGTNKNEKNVIIIKA